VLAFKEELETEMKAYLKASIVKLMAIKREIKQELIQTREDCLAEINDFGQKDLKAGVMVELKALLTKQQEEQAKSLAEQVRNECAKQLSAAKTEDSKSIDKIISKRVEGLKLEVTALIQEKMPN